MDKLLADKYFCNFSLFQSLPDAWAIDQIFPIVPLQRLNERPTRSATLQDITCDSDGKIANFVTNRNISNILPVHALRKNEPYYLGVFLVGAYQEILGDMHNLFGDTNAAHITVKDGKYHIDQIFDGETVEEVLEYVQYNPKKLVRQLEVWVAKSVKQGKIHIFGVKSQAVDACLRFDSWRFAFLKAMPQAVKDRLLQPEAWPLSNRLIARCLQAG